MSRRSLAALCALLVAGASLASDREPVRSVVDQQASRASASLSVVLPDGHRAMVTLIDLAPSIHVWFLVKLHRDDGVVDTWHLENPTGLAQRVRLDGDAPEGLMLGRGDTDHPCALWTSTPHALAAARASGQVFAPVCGGALWVRNPTVGTRSSLEWTTDFLRDHVWGGEAITTAAKETLFADAQRETSELQSGHAGVASAGGPARAAIDPAVAGRLLDRGSMGLPVDGTVGPAMEVGGWYPVRGVPGLWASVLQARFLDPAVIARNAGRVNSLDAVEAASLVYTAAYDLSAFDLGFEIGTDHPRVDWSTSAGAGVRDPSLPGPDGFGDLNPLVRAGKVSPAWLPGLVSVFVGGFRRQHGAFKAGPLSLVNGASHYGFVEFGTELSRLQPGLATLVVWADQSVELRTWTEADATRLGAVRHARQNGVAIVETDPATGAVRPGAFVRSWGSGNWSGSVEGNLRSARSAVCIQDTPRGRFLLYSYFSSATPSGMADVFAAYGCSYGMLLDMNALEHTYLAVDRVEDGALVVHHLVEGMEVLDRVKGGKIYPRFVGAADNRDFFYVMRKPRTSP